MLPRCKACVKEFTKERAALAGQFIDHPLRYYLGSDGRIHCKACNGYVYDSGMDGEQYCLSCGRYINPPPMPKRLVTT